MIRSIHWLFILTATSPSFSFLHNAVRTKNIGLLPQYTIEAGPQYLTVRPSVHKLLEDLVLSSSRDIDESPRTVFVGGKGGVGKTSISSSLAVTLASDLSHDLNVLVVSTDPAHSLGDALDIDLKSSKGKPVQMTDPLTMGKLFAMEVDTTSAIENFQNALSAFDIQQLSSALGIQPELLDNLGLSELNDILKNPPPGLDELVALSNIMNDPDISRKFDIIIVDTAPTGHTLRMLALPEFLDGFLGKLLDLRMKLSGLANTLQVFLGGGNAAATRAETIDKALKSLEQFRTQMNTVRKRLCDTKSTNFVVVTIPSTLGVNESKRLISELRDQGIHVSDVVVNQCIIRGDESYGPEAIETYYKRRKLGQDKWLHVLQEAINDVSSSPEYQRNGAGSINLLQIPYIDAELVGSPALSFLGGSVFGDNESFKALMEDDGTKFVICGGKGGVGKTTVSSSLAVSMATNGHKVALISTDPAHSLGDAFNQNFGGGKLCDVELYGNAEGSLSVLEIDPTKALDEFKEIVDRLISSPESSNDNSDMKKTLKELGTIFDTLPAGTDEVVALAKVIGLVNRGDFDRIVLDTAPTGHTLRLLSTPSFISDLIDKILAVARRVNSNPFIKMMISSAVSGEADVNNSAQSAKQALLSFQIQMYELEDLFSNQEKTEFLIVTIPTELAVRESVRLLNDLTFEAPDQPIKVRHVVANQVLRDDNSDVGLFLNRLRETQRSSMSQLRQFLEDDHGDIQLTEVAYLDTEPRGVYGLKALSIELLKNEILCKI